MRFAISVGSGPAAWLLSGVRMDPRCLPSAFRYRLPRPVRPARGAARPGAPAEAGS